MNSERVVALTLVVWLAALAPASTSVTGTGVTPQTAAGKTVAAYVAFVDHELRQRTAFALTRENDTALWSQVSGVATSFLTDEWKHGTLQGRNADEAFFVRCDRSTMTQDDLDNGVLVLIVGVARVRPAEFETVRVKLLTDAPNYLIVDGERFHADTIIFASKDCSAMWWPDRGNQGRAQSTHIRMLGKLNDAPVVFELNFPAHEAGTFDLTHGEGDAYTLSHLAMLSQSDVKTYGDGARATLRRLTVTISRYDAVGGLIRGQVDGLLFMTSNAPYREIDIHVTGRFSITRSADSPF